jgi:four helix bundle protein
VTRVCQAIHERDRVGRLMVPQVVSAATSVMAMLEEARGAESRRDFISKISIALKESREVHARLRVFEACDIGPTDDIRALVRDADQLVAILTAIVRNAKRNTAPRSAAATDKP